VSVFCQDEFAAHGLRPAIAEANIASNRQKGALLSFTVRLIQNLNARLQRFLPAGHLAEEACHTEIDVLKEPIGKQEQYASAFGGVNQFVFHSDGRTTVQRIFLAADTVQRLEASLFLFHLGGSRSASSILKEQTNNLDRTKVFETRRAMVGQADVGIKLPQDGDVDAHGLLLHEARFLKKTLASKITSDVIDAYHQKGLEAGALGGKLAGGGDGGFLLFRCPPRARRFFLTAISELRRVPFGFEFNGSRVIHVSDE
jgi:D-glycero-alpha-D-manno-heptose-7-phosphate kinase